MALGVVMNGIDPGDFLIGFSPEQRTRRPGPAKGLVNDPPTAVKFRPFQVIFKSLSFVDRRRFRQGDDDHFRIVTFKARQ